VSHPRIPETNPSMLERLRTALTLVSQDLYQDIIQRARMTNTPIILCDRSGQVVKVHPDDLEAFVASQNQAPELP